MAAASPSPSSPSRSGAGLAALVWRMLPPMHVALQALAVVGLYGAGYLILARLTGAEELGFWLGRFARR